MSSETQKRERPLSPHLQVYKMHQMTSMLSILHRATGVVLAMGVFLMVWWLVSAAMGAYHYEIFQNFIVSEIGILITIGLSFAFFYHFCNGIRHLIWDTGRLFKIEDARTAGYIVFYSALLITASMWGLIFKGGVFACLY